mgnify:CR=1 FL=1
MSNIDPRIIGTWRMTSSITPAIPLPSPITTAIEDHDHCEGHCVLQEVWVSVGEEMRSHLDACTLADLVERTRRGHAAPTS